jgi:hypothetical protein
MRCDTVCSPRCSSRFFGNVLHPSLRQNRKPSVQKNNGTYIGGGMLITELRVNQYTYLKGKITDTLPPDYMVSHLTRQCNLIVTVVQHSNLALFLYAKNLRTMHPWPQKSCRLISRNLSYPNLMAIPVEIFMVLLLW